VFYTIQANLFNWLWPFSWCSFDVDYAGNTAVDDVYRALGCDIEALTEDSRAYHDITRMISADPAHIQIKNIFKLRRCVEESALNQSKLHNKKLLFHASKVLSVLRCLFY
jgi:hypothetical protein